MGFEYDDELDAGYGAEDEENNDQANEEKSPENEQSEGDEEEQDEEDEDEEDDEDEDPKVQEQKQKQLQARKDKIEEAKLKTKLNIISSTVSSTGAVALDPMQMKDVADAKRFKNLRLLIALIFAKIAINITKKVIKTVGKFLAPAMPYILIGLCVLIAIVALVVILSSLFNGSGNTMMGVNGKDFYGVRMVYESVERSRNDLIDDYLTLVEDSINTIDGKSVGSEQITVNVELPADDYEIDYNTFGADYAELNGIVFEISKIVSESDNGTPSSASTLQDCLDEVKYFGFPENKTSEIASVVSDFIERKSTVGEEKKPLTQDMSGYINFEGLTTRAEKVYIKDYILETDEAMQSGVTDENYLAVMFMPKRNVTFNTISFILLGEDLSGFDVKLKNGTTDLSINKTADDYSDNSGVLSDIYECNSLVSASTFQDIDVNNLGALGEGLSLYEIINTDGLNKDVYLTSSEENADIMTYKTSGVTLLFEYANPNAERKPFKVNEFATEWT